MFHFTGYRVSFPILFRKERLHITGARLPHSEISGSKVVCTSPKLIAAYHVFHRLSAPRHSLYALNYLIPVSRNRAKRCGCLKSTSRCDTVDPFARGRIAKFAVGVRWFRRPLAPPGLIHGPQKKGRVIPRTARQTQVILVLSNQPEGRNCSWNKSSHGCQRAAAWTDTVRRIRKREMVGQAGLEPATPRLSSACSNQLSYRPIDQ